MHCPLFSSCVPIVLNFNRALKTVSLGRNNIGNEGTAALSEALKSNNTLETLELYENQIGVAGAQSLADILQVNRALTTLNLASNDIGVPDGWSMERDMFGPKYKHTDGRTQGERPQGTSSGVMALAESLKVNRALASLDLRNNRIGAEGAKAIADSLPQS